MSRTDSWLLIGLDLICVRMSMYIYIYYFILFHDGRNERYEALIGRDTLLCSVPPCRSCLLALKVCHIILLLVGKAVSVTVGLSGKRASTQSCTVVAPLLEVWYNSMGGGGFSCLDNFSLGILAEPGRNGPICRVFTGPGLVSERAISCQT